MVDAPKTNQKIARFDSDAAVKYHNERTASMNEIEKRTENIRQENAERRRVNFIKQNKARP